MSNLTIDQILAECSDEPTVYSDFEKEASSQPSTSSTVSSDEVEQMASLLKQASIEDAVTEQQVNYVTIPRTFEEKVAEAIILNETLQEMATPEAMFKTAAIEAGYEPEEIDSFLEKKALNSTEAKKGLKYLLAAGGISGVGAGSYVAGRKRGRSKGRKEGFYVGRLIQRKIDSGLR